MKKATTIKLESPFVYTVYVRNPEKKSKRPLSENMKTVLDQMADGGKYEPETFAERSAMDGLLARGLVKYALLEEIDNHGHAKRPAPEELILREIFNEKPFPKGTSHMFWVRTSNPGADRPRHLVPGTDEPVVGRSESKGETR